MNQCITTLDRLMILILHQLDNVINSILCIWDVDIIMHTCQTCNNSKLLWKSNYFNYSIISVNYCKSVEYIHLVLYFKTCLSFSSEFHVEERIFKIFIKLYGSDTIQSEWIQDVNRHTRIFLFNVSAAGKLY